jgi:hypothetical protein
MTAMSGISVEDSPVSIRRWFLDHALGFWNGEQRRTAWLLTIGTEGS